MITLSGPMLKYDAGRDYYRILGVSDSASPMEIKRAFRALMRGAHPDVNRDRPEAKQWAQDLNESYEVLTTRRAEYDLVRREAVAAKSVRAAAPKRKAARREPSPAPVPAPAGTSAGDILAGIALVLGVAAVAGGI